MPTSEESYHEFVARYRAAERDYDEACSSVLERASQWEKRPIRATADTLRMAVRAWRKAGAVFTAILEESKGGPK